MVTVECYDLSIYHMILRSFRAVQFYDFIILLKDLMSKTRVMYLSIIQRTKYNELNVSVLMF